MCRNKIARKLSEVKELLPDTLAAEIILRGHYVIKDTDTTSLKSLHTFLSIFSVKRTCFEQILARESPVGVFIV